MVKNIIKLSIVTAISTSSVVASTQSGLEATLELAYTKKINQTIERVNKINKYINRYILQNISAPTKDQLKATYSLSDSDFTSYSGSFTFSVDSSKVHYTDVVSNFSEVQKRLYKNNSLLLPLSVINSDLSLDIALDPKSVVFLKKVTELGASLTAPADTSKLWYKPNGQGGFTVYHHDGSSWKVAVSNTSSDKDVSNSTTMVAKSKDELDKLKANKADVAYVSNQNGTMQKYVYDGESWLLESVTNTVASSNSCSVSDIGVMKYDKESNCMQSCQKVGDDYSWECVALTAGAGVDNSSGDTININTALDPATLTHLNDTAVTLGDLKTGQTTSFYAHDDGATKSGVARSYSRDDAQDVVVDNATHLMWQDSSFSKTTPLDYESALLYCEALDLGDYTSWRVPTVKELMSLVDRSTSSKMDTSFKNTKASSYWSKTTDASSSSNAWYISFSSGGATTTAKSGSLYLRCVHDIEK